MYSVSTGDCECVLRLGQPWPSGHCVSYNKAVSDWNEMSCTQVFYRSRRSCKWGVKKINRERCIHRKSTGRNSESSTGVGKGIEWGERKASFADSRASIACCMDVPVSTRLL